MGAWIETVGIKPDFGFEMSHPTWVRGLKLNDQISIIIEMGVAPYVGAWIET